MIRRWPLILALAATGMVAAVTWHFLSGNEPTGRASPRNGPVQGALISAPLRQTGPPPLVQPIPPQLAATDPLPSAPPVAPNPATSLSAPPASSGPASPLPIPVPMEGEFQAVTFDRLASFEYVMPPEPMTNSPAVIPGGSDQIPAEIKAYDARVLGVKGFMLPLKVQNGLVTELLLMRDQSMCCYGVVPKLNEWVNVKMNGQGVKPIMDQPVTMVGRFQVGEVRENGYLVCLYRMEADRMLTSLDY